MTGTEIVWGAAKRLSELKQQYDDGILTEEEFMLRGIHFIIEAEHDLRKRPNI